LPRGDHTGYGHEKARGATNQDYTQLSALESPIAKNAPAAPILRPADLQAARQQLNQKLALPPAEAVDSHGMDSSEGGKSIPHMPLGLDHIIGNHLNHLQISELFDEDKARQM
jgi:hypothetical protein